MNIDCITIFNSIFNICRIIGYTIYFIKMIIIYRTIKIHQQT